MNDSIFDIVNAMVTDRLQLIEQERVIGRQGISISAMRTALRELANEPVQYISPELREKAQKAAAF